MGETRRYIVDAATIARGDLDEIIDPIWMGSNFYGGPLEYEATLRQFSDGQRWVWAVLWYDREVANGGHDQFFGNSTGSVWSDALEGLAVIGLTDLHQILREAVSRFDGLPSRVRSEREAQLERCELGFDDLDDRYYAVADRPSEFHARLLVFVRANAEMFLFDADVTHPD
jgi:Domain of unknown function (DUF4375)